MGKNKLSVDVTSPGDLAAKFAAGKLPTEAAFHMLIDWAYEWQVVFGWDEENQTYSLGAGFKLEDEKLALKIGHGIEIGPGGLRVKLASNGGIQLSHGELHLDDSVAVNSAAFARLPQNDLNDIFDLLKGSI